MDEDHRNTAPPVRLHEQKLGAAPRRPWSPRQGPSASRRPKIHATPSPILRIHLAYRQMPPMARPPMERAARRFRRNQSCSRRRSPGLRRCGRTQANDGDPRRRRKAVTGTLVPRPTKSRNLVSDVNGAVPAARGAPMPGPPVALAQPPHFELGDGNEIHEPSITPAEPLRIQLHC